MGLLNKLFRRRHDPLSVLNDAIERLSIGILLELITDYASRGTSPPRDEAVDLANCVLSHAMLMDPVGEQAQRYQQSHVHLIRDQALQLAANANVSQALAYLYAATTLLLAIRSGDPLSELSVQLGARATELSIPIPGPHDICGSADGLECIRAIAAFSMNYQREVNAR